MSSEMIMIVVYVLSAVIVSVAYFFHFKNEFVVTLKDLIFAIFVSFSPLVNTICAILFFCVWFDKAEKIVIYKRKVCLKE